MPVQGEGGHGAAFRGLLPDEDSGLEIAIQGLWSTSSHIASFSEKKSLSLIQVPMYIAKSRLWRNRVLRVGLQLSATSFSYAIVVPDAEEPHNLKAARKMTTF
jgi:hypothetical protein